MLGLGLGLGLGVAAGRAVRIPPVANILAGWSFDAVTPSGSNPVTLTETSANAFHSYSRAVDAVAGQAVTFLTTVTSENRTRGCLTLRDPENNRGAFAFYDIVGEALAFPGDTFGNGWTFNSATIGPAGLGGRRTLTLVATPNYTQAGGAVGVAIGDRGSGSAGGNHYYPGDTTLPMLTVYSASIG